MKLQRCWKSQSARI